MDISEPYVDDDGFQLEFERGCSMEERLFYIKTFPNVNLLIGQRIYCTSCKKIIGVAPISTKKFRMHPVLHVIQCFECAKFYDTGEFEKGEDGSELYCRWCGQGGNVYCCSSCPYVFCKKCILMNFTRATLTEISNNESWKCFMCASNAIWHLRVLHWAVVNLYRKEKSKADTSAYSVNADESTDKISLNASVDNVNNIEGFNKSMALTEIHDKQTPKSKKRSVSNASAELRINQKYSPSPLPTASNKISGEVKEKRISQENETISKTELHTSNESQTLNESKMNKIIRIDLGSSIETETETEAQPIIACEAITSRTEVITPTTANNFTSGKLLMIDENDNSAENPEHLTIPDANEAEVVNKNTNQKSKEMYAAKVVPINSATCNGVNNNEKDRSPIYHKIDGYRVNLNSLDSRSLLQLPNGKVIHVRREMIDLAKAKRISHIKNLQTEIGAVRQDHNQHTPSVQTSPHNVHTNQKSVAYIDSLETVQSTPRSKSPVEATSNNHIKEKHIQLEHQLLNGIDVCDHIKGKLQTIMKSNAYKNVKSLSDIKEMYIHLSYIFSYVNSRIQTIQKKCVDELKTFEIQNEAKQSISDNFVDDNSDDIEIVEPERVIIELESDSEDEQCQQQDSILSKISLPEQELSKHEEEAQSQRNSSITIANNVEVSS